MSREIPAITIDGRPVAADYPPFVIAEIGLNHGGSVDRALALVDAAAAAGATAIKLQTIFADEFVAPSCPAPAHVTSTSLAGFFADFELDESAHREIASHARLRGLRVISTPFSERAVDLLERVGVDAYKIASGDITFDQLIIRAARTNKPVIISTGMATLAESRAAIDLARSTGTGGVALMHCVSAYPVPRGSENLLAIKTLVAECHVPVGLSDHGDDAFAASVAIALGASLYERHIVLDSDGDEVIDRAVSSTASELTAAIDAMRRAWHALGSGRKACLAAESVNVAASRRSLCAARDLPAGTILSPADLIALRPGTGKPPSDLFTVCGLQILRSMSRGEPLDDAHFEAFSLPESGRVA